jgi:transcriptional regulator with XRE-family HTH domain
MKSARFVLVNARREMGLTQAQAAQQIGVSKRTVERLEGGELGRPATLRRVLDFYRLPFTVGQLWPEALLPEEEEEQPEGVAA